MLDRTWREQTWRNIDQHWEIIVIGGGITGAGIFNMAAQKGLKVLLVEARDFAFGTSSRSSKLVHGGIRYLRNRQFDVVRESVREREYLVQQDKKGKELLKLTRQEVKITGVLRKAIKGQKTIRVKAYQLVSGEP